MPIQQIECESAEDFLAVLRPTNARWCTMWPPRRRWAFRGQADAEWPLLPKLWRSTAPTAAAPYWQDAAMFADSRVPESGAYKTDPQKRIRTLDILIPLFAEWMAVRRFCELADELGLETRDIYVGTESQISHVIDGRHFAGALFAPDEGTALAQHHGVPTRLLDWTRRALIAAYFAASDAFALLNQPQAPSHIAVWAVCTDCMKEDARVQSFQYPKHRNLFLRAQDGVFLFDSKSDTEYAAIGKRLCIGEVVASQGDSESHRVYKIILPTSQVPKMLDLLLIERVSKAHLMPTYDNVAATIMQHNDPRVGPWVSHFGL